MEAYPSRTSSQYTQLPCETPRSHTKLAFQDAMHELNFMHTCECACVYDVEHPYARNSRSPEECILSAHTQVGAGAGTTSSSRSGGCCACQEVRIFKTDLRAC